MRLPRMTAAVALALLTQIQFATAPALADTLTDASTDVPTGAPQRLLSDSSLHIHGGVGAGLAIMSSDDLTELFDDRFGIGLGIHLSASVAIGVKHYLQAEVRWGDSAHTLRDNNIVTNETTEIPMDYDFTEYVGKINVLALRTAGRERGKTALYLVAGVADIEYLDELGDGLTGSSSLLGMEYTRFGSHVSATVGVRKYAIEFDEITLGGLNGRYEVDASNWVLHTSMAVGLGF